MRLCHLVPWAGLPQPLSWYVVVCHGGVCVQLAGQTGLYSRASDGSGLQGPEGNRRRQPPIFPDPVNGAVQSRRAGGHFLVLPGSSWPASPVGSERPASPVGSERKAAFPALPLESRSFRPSFWELCLQCGFPVGQRLLDVSVQHEGPPRSWAKPCPLFCLESLALFWPLCLRARLGVFSRTSKLGSVGAGPGAGFSTWLGPSFRGKFLQPAPT